MCPDVVSMSDIFDDMDLDPVSSTSFDPGMVDSEASHGNTGRGTRTLRGTWSR